MKHTLKNRIISGFVALLLILTTTLSSGIVFGENEQADVLAVQEDTQATDETDANDDNEEGMQASDSQTGDDEIEVGSSDDTSEGEKITGNEADSNAMDSDVNASGTDSEENNSQTNDSTENASNGKTSANDNNSETNIADDTELEHQNIEICPDETDPEKTVTLDGLMPKEAAAEVVDVTEQSETENVIAAYDITIVDGEEEYQPGEENPINVEITDPRITDGSNLQIWHITDDGEREEITDFTVEDGKVCFDAAGFSVYEIVEKTLTPPTGTGWFQIKTSDEFTAHAMDGIYISHTGGHFVSNEQYNISTTRTGILRTTEKAQEPGLAVSMKQAAAPFYFELQQDGTYKVYCYAVENGQSVIKYVKQREDSLSLVAESDASTFSVEKRDGNNSNFVIAVTGTGTSRYCWNRQGGDNGSGFAAYKGTTDGNAQLNFFYYVPVPDDPYGLDGETYGLMNYVSGSDGKALMAEGATNSLSMLEVPVRAENEYRTLYVTEDASISMWTFHKAGEDYYYLSSSVGGNTMYLKMDNSGFSFVDTTDSATRIQVIPAGNNSIKLVADGRALCFSEENGFSVGAVTNATTLSFVKVSDIDQEEKVTYSAKKIGVSETNPGKQVVIYTRVWNDTKKTYEFYAVDHDGTLIPCFERGDDIMWTGSPISTFLWTFIEHYWDDGSPNYYYDLKNVYTGQFLAPLLQGGRVLTDVRPGINMPGRQDGEYYSTIIAWDDIYYKYAGLKADVTEGKVVSCPKKDADTFYFAVLDEVEPTLTEIRTVDNTDYGITMKMVDFTTKQKREGSGDKVYNEQDDVLGDYTTSHDFSPLKDLLSTNLVNGYPVAVNTGQSLSELFGASKEVNHLFIESTHDASGYFEYDSCQNFASLKGRDSGDFTVYKELGTMNSRANKTDKHGQFMPFNDIQAGVYSTKNINVNDISGNPLPENDPRKYEKLHLVGNLNDTNATDWYFGMELEASFAQTPSGKDAWGHDIIFEFTGDDDFWFYVDGELVIDLGGIHSALAGSVNFSTGDVIVNGQKTKLRTVFENNFRSRNPNATNEQVSAYLAEYFDGDEEIFKDYSNHTMKIFYMERGAGASNLHMRFNLSYVNPGSVVFSKEVTGTSNLDFELVEYPYQIWYKDSQPDPPGQTLNHEHLLTNSYDDINVVYQNSTQKVDYLASYTPPGSNVVYPSVYFLHPGKAAEIFFPDDTIEYKIIECGINHEVYDQVNVNGTTITGTALGESNRNSYDSGWLSVSERPRVAFENHVDPDGLRTLTFRKELTDKDGTILEPSDDPTLYNFRLYLSNGVNDNSLSLAYMAKYYVRDLNDYYCYWDSESQKFMPSQYNKQEDLAILETDSEEVAKLKASLVHETSMNGAISKIPAWYTVEVPNITVGTYFKVVERFSETDLGYGRIEYMGNPNTYRRDPSAQYENAGWVIANETPYIAIRNQRGYSIQTNKVWSDKAYMKSHDPIYLALYLDGEDDPVSGYVRVLNSSDSYVRFFLQDLAPGKTLEDYEVYEVELEEENEGDLRIDEDGVVTNYKSITKVIQNGSTTVNGVAKGSTVSTPYEYSVTYEKGPLGKSNPALTEDNTRTDTITNTREGGIAITLYEMNTNIPLADGEFTIKKKIGENQYETVGTYQSDAEGRVTILYEFDRDTEYVLTETASPSGYIGLPNPVSFWLDTNGVFHFDGNGNEAMWQNGYNSDLSTGDKLVAYLDVYNRPFTIEVYKYDGASNGLSGLKQAHFELFRGVKGFGGTLKDFVPMSGYEDLVTGQNGRITGINHELAPNTYYLTEKTPPAGYQGLDGDVVFKISPLGAMELVSKPEGSGVELVTDEDGAVYKYYLNIPNNRIDGTDATLTVTKTVTGNMGNKSRDFTFHFEVTGDDGSSGYAWKKNDVLMDEALISGGTFTLGHNDKVEITVPAGAEVKITEENDGYDTSFKLGNADAEEVATKTFTVSDDITLAVTNSLNAAIPTGVWMSFGTLLLLGGLCLIGIFCITSRKRRTETFLERMRERRR